MFDRFLVNPHFKSKILIFTWENGEYRRGIMEKNRLESCKGKMKIKSQRYFSLEGKLIVRNLES